VILVLPVTAQPAETFLGKAHEDLRFSTSVKSISRATACSGK